MIAFAATGAADDAIREHQHVITLTPVGQDIPLAAIDAVMALNLDSLAERLLLESMAARDAQSSIYSRLGMLMTKQGKKDEQALAHGPAPRSCQSGSDSGHGSY